MLSIWITHFEAYTARFVDAYIPPISRKGSCTDAIVARLPGDGC